MENIKFNQLNLSPAIMSVLSRKKFENTTPVQAQAIPALMEWKDVVAKAPTGTGKTLAFGIPVIEHIDTTIGKIQALILAPTRELALQICAELKELAQYKKGVRITSIYGGQSIDLQIRALKKRPQIIVATPGRLLDHINRRTIRLDCVETAVLDEADRMVDMGFYKDVTAILDLTTSRTNLALLSATVSGDVVKISRTYQQKPLQVTVPENRENKPDIKQYSLRAAESEKIQAIDRIIHSEHSSRAIVFCNTRHKVKKLTSSLCAKGYAADCIHGEVRQSTREKVLGNFRVGKLRILVATDVAARGIDVDNVDTIFNYDIPAENDYYIHRIGRTGRAKKHGVAYTFVSNSSDRARLGEIARYTKTPISPLTMDVI